MNNDSLRNLKGIGEKTEKLFAKLGITTLQQLLHYYPRDYDCFEHPMSLSQIKAGDRCAVSVQIPYPPSVKGNQKRSVVLLVLKEENIELTLTWFNMPFLRSTLKRGGVYVFRGNVQEKNRRLCMDQPEIYTPAQYAQLERSLQPVYGLTKGLTGKMVSKAVAQVLETSAPGTEYLPEELRENMGLCDINYALHRIHFPRSAEELKTARQRLAFEEFFFFLLALSLLKNKTEDFGNEFPMKPVWTTEEVIENLPFALTGAQRNVWLEMQADLCGHSRMARLIQGDVGSGKTILAFLSMILAAENGYQAALMVPTEVLAEQHYESLLKLLRDNQLEDRYMPELLTGSTKQAARKRIYKNLADGSCRMVIGTHALIQENVVYQKLALVITDEQHRFGVKQRTALAEKGQPPHVCVMSATPIPRTLALILYGDLALSVIDELPANRLPIKNCVVDTSYRPKAYKFIRNQVVQGHQVYVICPMVEASEELDAENVTDYTQLLRKEFPDLKIGMLHGRMKPAEKNEIMTAFSTGDLQILVSTTVVEVGVNVPNATVMMIENSERFGLAQLHQLRGRVGRGTDAAWCFLMSGGTEKLSILTKTNDGFIIAEKDMELRGPGDLFGTRQSGAISGLSPSVNGDTVLLELTHELAKDISESNKEEDKLLCMIADRWIESRSDVIFAAN